MDESKNHRRFGMGEAARHKRLSNGTQQPGGRVQGLPCMTPRILTLVVGAALATLQLPANAACVMSPTEVACGPGDALSVAAPGLALTSGVNVQLNGADGNPVTVSVSDLVSPLFSATAPAANITFAATNAVFNANATVLQGNSFGGSTLKLENSTVNIGQGAAPLSRFADPWSTQYAVFGQNVGGGSSTIELNNVEFKNQSATPGNVMNLVYANSSNTTPGPQVHANGVTTSGPVDYGFVISGQGASLLLENSRLTDVNLSAISNDANDYSLGRDMSQITIKNSTISGNNDADAIHVYNNGADNQATGFRLDISDSYISSGKSDAIGITVDGVDEAIAVNVGVQDIHTPSILDSAGYTLNAYNVTHDSHQPITIVAGGGVQINSSGAEYGDGLGILAYIQDGDGAVTVRNAATIRVQGDGTAYGISTLSNGAILVDSREGDIHVAGKTMSVGIDASENGHSAPHNQSIHVMAGAIDAPNQNAAGVFAYTTDGVITIDVTKTISAPGKRSTGVQTLLYDTTSTINILPEGVIAGGALDPASSIYDNKYAVGILTMLGDGATRAQTSTINNEGSIGAMSDAAIRTLKQTAIQADQNSGVMINNHGTITGFVDLASVIATGQQNTFNNYSPNSFVIRNFADTDGDGMRDTKAVSVSNFGGPNALFNNAANGAIRFAAVTGNTATDTTGQYVPTTGSPGRSLDASVYSLTGPGVVQGQFVNLATFINSGVIDLTGPSVGNVLAITGNPTMATPATGSVTSGTFISNGGTLRVNAVLNAGMAPGATTGSQADMLVVDRAQTGVGGATRIFVFNQGGLGAATRGNGIELVEVRDKSPGASNAGAFALGQRAAVGAYDYMLQQNGVGADAADGNWYLRSTLRSEIPLYQAVPALASRMGLDMLGTYHDRQGEDYLGFGGANAKAPRHATWGRVYGGNQNTRLSGGGQDRLDQYASDGPAYDMTIWGMQTGTDLYHRHDDARKISDVAGLYFGYSHGRADVENVENDSRAGSVKTDGYSLGGYWTRKGAGGWYVDGVLQATYFGGIKADSSMGQTLSTDGWSLAASVESGYPIDIGAGWKLEPQVQLIYQYMDIKDAEDDFGQVRYSSNDGMYARVGARLDKTFTTSGGHQVTPWVRANLWLSPDRAATTRFSTLSGANTVAMTSNLGGTWMQVGAGISGRIKKNVSVFVAGDYNFNVGDRTSHGVAGRVGLKVAW